ncbi:MAG TPA: hypothetical protein VIG64_08510 [Actinomycetota bacterium]
MDVDLERRRGRTWRAVAGSVTAADGSFRFRVPRKGDVYRATVDDTSGEGASGPYTCRAAASRPQRAK